MPSKKFVRDGGRRATRTDAKGRVLIRIFLEDDDRKCHIPKVGNKTVVIPIHAQKVSAVSEAVEQALFGDGSK